MHGIDNIKLDEQEEKIIADYYAERNTVEKAPSRPVEPRKEVSPGDLSKKKLEAVREAFTRVYGEMPMGAALAMRAISVINGERQEDYGPPHENFSRVAHLWSGYKGIHFSSHDVALMLALLKIARAKQDPWKGSDSLVDLVGYALLADELMPEKK